MIVTDLAYQTNLDSGVNMQPLKNAFLSGDQEAHRFAVSCYRSRGRESVDLTGAGVTGYFVRANGSTVVINGHVADNKAVLLLPAACYAVQGHFSLVIKASLGNVIQTILWVEGAVSRSRTDKIIDPGSVVPTLDELLAQIDRMEQATARAEAAAKIAEDKLDKNLGAQYAGKLLFVDNDGTIVTLTLGEGLVVENGILRATGGGGESATDQVFYTADGSLFHTLDNAIFHVKGG